MKPSTYEEKELLQRIANGDEDAFRLLFQIWHQKLGAFVLGWTKSLPLAEEIVQDAFLKVWAKRAQLPEVERFGAWLFTLARNHTLNALRQAARERSKVREWQRWLETDLQASDASVPEDLWLLIEEAVTRLPPQQKNVYLLKRQAALTYDQIADKLGISPETARKHLTAAQKNIHAYIRTHLNITLLVLSTPLLFG